MIIHSMASLNLALVPHLTRNLDNLPSQGADNSNDGAPAQNNEA